MGSWKLELGVLSWLKPQEGRAMTKRSEFTERVSRAVSQATPMEGLSPREVDEALSWLERAEAAEAEAALQRARADRMEEDMHRAEAEASRLREENTTGTGEVLRLAEMAAESMERADRLQADNSRLASELIAARDENRRLREGLRAEEVAHRATARLLRPGSAKSK